MAHGVPRSTLIEKYVTEQTAPSDADQIKRALEGRLYGPLTTDETVNVLLKTVRALYLVNVWLADELDKVEASIGATKS